MNPATLTGLVGTALGAVALMPQVVKLHRSKDIAGLSATWVGVGVAANTCWVVYLIHERLAIAATATAIATAFFVVVWAQMSQNGLAMRMPAVNSTMFAICLAVIGVSFGWTVLGVTLGLTYVVQVAPSLVAAFRATHPSGVAPWTWMMSFTEGALWMYYGFWHRSVPIMMFSASAMLAGALMVARFVATRPTTEPAV